MVFGNSFPDSFASGFQPIDRIQTAKVDGFLQYHFQVYQTKIEVMLSSIERC